MKIGPLVQELLVRTNSKMHEYDKVFSCERLKSDVMFHIIREACTLICGWWTSWYESPRLFRLL